MTSFHDVTIPDLPISACRCAREMILFLFLWFSGWVRWYTLLIFYLHDVLTSGRHVMTSQNLVYLSKLVDVLDSWFFFCFYDFFDDWDDKRHCLFLCDIVTSWRHFTTSQYLIYLSQLVDVLEKVDSFLFPWFIRSLSSKMYLIFYLCHALTSWRHVMMSQSLHHLSQLSNSLKRWFFWCCDGFSCWWFRDCNRSCISGMISCHNVTSYRHVITKHHPTTLIVSCS